jgi:hypothetical protein
MEIIYCETPERLDNGKKNAAFINAIVIHFALLRASKNAKLIMREDVFSFCACFFKLQAMFLNKFFFEFLFCFMSRRFLF